MTTLPGGSYTLQAYYQGDATHAPSTSGNTIPVVVSPESSSPFLSLAILDLAMPNQYSQNPTTATYGEYGFAYVAPANANALNVGVGSHGSATGTATLLNNSTVIGTQALNSQGLAAFPLANLPPGTYSFSATYSGDGSYNASTTSTNLPLTISQGRTTLVLHTGTGATTGQNRTITVEVDTDSTGAAPTGAVTLSFNGTNYTSTSVQNGALSTGAIALYENFAVPATAITGSNRLSATYAGDTNYSASTAATCSFAPPAATAGAVPQGGRHLFFATEGGAVLCAVLLFGVPARRRAWRALLGLVLTVGLIGAVGCGSSSSATSSPTPGPVVSACAQ